jgi:hypothetical protein
VPSVALLKNIALTDIDTGGQTSSVGEPSIANNGDEIFVSGNWYATKSLDGAATWAFVDPFNLLPTPGSEFCCDQVVLYDPSRNLLFWLLQYVRDQNGTNVLRLAVKKGGTLGDDSWYWWDFSPEKTNAAWVGEWFDYPDLELSDNFLCVTTNSFRGEQWHRSVVFRLPLDALAGSGSLNYRYWSTTQNFSLRCVRGAKNVMHFASHNSLSQVRVFSWPEAANGPSFHDVNVASWNAGSYAAPGADGTNWLQRCDPRITGAWVAKGKIGLAWSANRRGARPYPYVRVVEIDEQTMQDGVNHDIWSPNYAYAYPNGCPNDQGEIGITLFRGGNTINPGHVVGFWNEATQHWQLRATASGTNGPADNKWGDYLACRRHVPDGLTWIATGYTLKGGGARTNIEPRVVIFGR